MMSIVKLHLDGLKFVGKDEESRGLLAKFGYPDGLLCDPETVFGLMKKTYKTDLRVQFPLAWMSAAQLYAAENAEAMMKAICSLPCGVCVFFLMTKGIGPEDGYCAHELLWLAIGAGLVDPPYLINSKESS